MFNHLFENRNSTVTNLIKLGDCLGRSLRENIELFSIDSENQKVAYLTESGKVISGYYDISDDLKLEDIDIQDSDIFSENASFDTYVNEKVSDFVGSLYRDSYSQAEDSFSNILSLWENRLKFDSVRKKLNEKATLFSEDKNIINTEEVQRFLEMMPQFLSFLEENREQISEIKEIENAIKLSNSVSTAFNFPKITFDSLQESSSYKVSRGVNKSIYEMICKQELVRKELLESKNNFEDVWATNSKIRALAQLIFEDSEDVVLRSLVEAVVEVPYLALTSKKQLSESISNAFSLTDHSTITEKEIAGYASRLFEMKKPVKNIILNILNEKYGINIQTLKDVDSFSSLANTQVVIFESLSRLAPKGSALKATLSEVSKLLNNKNGVEVIDINDILQESFESCGYTQFCEKFNLVENLSFEEIFSEEMSAEQLLEKAKAKRKSYVEKSEKSSENEVEDEDDTMQKADEASADFSKPASFSPDGGDGEEEEEKSTKEELSDKQKELDVDKDGEIEGEDLAKLRKKKVKEEAEEATPADTSEKETSTDQESFSSEDLMKALSDLDGLLKDFQYSEDESEE